MTMIAQGSELELPSPVPAAARRRSSPRDWSTPTWLRGLTAAVLLLAVALGAAVTLGAADLRGGVRLIGRDTAPQVTAAADLSLQLTEMDAQLANVVLVGKEGAGDGRSAFVQRFDAARRRAAGDLQQAAVSRDPAVRRELGSTLEVFGRYQQVAGQVLYVDKEAAHPVAAAPEQVLRKYREATDLLEVEALPAADRLTGAHRAVLDRARRGQTGAAIEARSLVLVLGTGLVAALGWLQLLLYRRHHRLINPAVLLATVAALALVVPGARLFWSEEARARDGAALDSVLDLAQARAISRDANADASRFIGDEFRRDQYLQSFFARSQILVEVPGAKPDSYASDLATLYQSYGMFLGVLGTTQLPDKEPRAGQTLPKVLAYQKSVAAMRVMVRKGRLDKAAQVTTGYKPVEANYDFERYDRLLAGFQDADRRAYERHMAGGSRTLGGWTVFPGAAVVVVSALVIIGIRPRLAEFR